MPLTASSRLAHQVPADANSSEATLASSSPFLSPTRAPGLLPERAGPIRVMPGVSASDRAQGQRAQLGCERGHAVITPTPRETTASVADLSTEGWPHLARPEGGTGSQPGSTASPPGSPRHPARCCVLSALPRGPCSPLKETDSPPRPPHERSRPYRGAEPPETCRRRPSPRSRTAVSAWPVTAPPPVLLPPCLCPSPGTPSGSGSQSPGWRSGLCCCSYL